MRAYLVQFFVVVTCLLLPATFFAWWAEPLVGDLTRTGHWTERDFGSNSVQPAIHVQASGRSLVNPEISVLSDSFGAPNLWQSVLTETTGYSVKSFNYDKNCITNWVAAAIGQASNKIIVIETVERSFVARFADMPPCKNAEPVPMEITSGKTENHRTRWPPTLSWSYLAPTAMNTVALNFAPKNRMNNASVANVVIDAGCAGFSNRRNDRMLYFRDDELKERWSKDEIQRAIRNVSRLQQDVERSGKTFVFVIAPDKSSVYRRCLSSATEDQTPANINGALIAAGINAPDMLGIFREKVPATIDLYRPNDTHWSEVGYILAGETIGRYAIKKSGKSR